MKMLPCHPESPTYDRQNHDDKVKDVPAIGEVVVSQSQHFDDALPGENGNKKHVDFVEDVHFFLTLIICFHHHGNHVKADENHDGDIKGLF